MFSVYYLLTNEKVFTAKSKERCYWYIAQQMKKGFDSSLFVVVKAK